MNKQDELNKKLFNRLFLKMPTVRRLKIPINQVRMLKLDKSIKHIYYSKESNMWFAHSENKTKYFYFIGLHYGHINKLNTVSNSLVIDFDKNNNINDHSLGIINDLDMTVYLNKELLEKKYPNNDFKNINEHILNYFERSTKLKINTLELGKIYGTFYDNLKKLISELPLNSQLKPENISNNENMKSKEMNLFLNAIRAGKTYEQALQVAKINSSKVKYWYTYGKKGNKEYKEFYETYKEIMPRDEETYKKMKAIIDSLQSGKTEEEALALTGSSSSDIKKWIKKGKNGNLEFIDFYEEYDLINKKNAIESKNKTKEKNKKLIESYINLINEGKTNKEAIETLNIPTFKIKNWRRQGKLGNKQYKEFYQAYEKAISQEKSQKTLAAKKEDEKLINEYIKLINKGKTNKEAFETLNIPRFKTKNWKQQGQLGNPDYTEFYETYLMAIKIEEHNKANKFIELINEGKTNEEAIQRIKIPEFKIKQWFNKGKNGDKDFVEFYKAYMKQYDDYSKIENNVSDYSIKPPAKEIKTENKKSCEICGRSMREKDPNTICKRCRRKQRCANIIQKLLLSIEPEIPFKKDDLKRLNLTSIQIQDYIWVLQEFSLIKKEKNNKFSIVKKEILENFIEESGVEIIEETTTGIKLTKKCETCGETLEISKFPVSENSSDGYENNCKSCKKLISTATSLKEILEYVEYNKEFNEEDLAKYIKNPLLIKAKVWSLLDNDLLIKDFNTNKLKLANEEKCNEFLDKYFKESSSTQKGTEIDKPIINPPIDESTINNKQKQMEIVLQARREGKTRKEAAALAEISLYKITHWYKEGRDGFGEDNVYFFKKLKTIEASLLKKLKKQMNTVLKVLKKGGSIDEAINSASISQEELDNWIKKGKNDIKPYKSFLKEYQKYVKQSTDFNDEINVKGRVIFLNNIREGKTRKESAKKASMDLKLLDSWIIKGTKGQKPYNEFYIAYKEARKNTNVEPNSKEEKIKKEFINLMGQGYTLGEAAKLIENGAYAVEIKKWYIAGKKGVNKHLKFYVKCQEARNKFETNKNKIFPLISDGFTIKESCEKLKLDPVKIKKEFLNGKEGKIPEDKFYKKLITSKTSLIDIKSLFKYPDHPHKDQMIDVLDLLLIGESEKKALKVANVDEVTFKYWINRGKQNFGELYKEFYDIYIEIKTGELIKKFIKDIEKEIQKELDEIENENADILSLLPKQTRKELDNFSKEDLTGFAWVSKTGNLWIYSKKVQGRIIKITDTNLYNLHKKVIKNNFTWGVRDLNKAKKSLNITNENNDKNHLENDILSPLPENLKTKFSKGTKTGFAWVNKSGNYFYYIRAKQNIKIKAYSIEELYQEVTNNNYDWGVLDLKKAKKTLYKQNEEKAIENKHEIQSKSKDILFELPKEYEAQFKSTPVNKSGIAWVNKNGNQWIYSRKNNGKLIKFEHANIFKLHKKVINANQLWGIRDLKKAKLSLLSEPIDDKDYILSPLPKNNKLLNSKKSESGFVLVKKVGEEWEYERTFNGAKLSDISIFGLFEKILETNLTWGVTDIVKAKKSLGIDNLPSEVDDIENIDTSVENESILKPLPIEIEQKLRKNSKGNTSGFAWVSKVGQKWQYARIINGTPIHLKDTDIFKLHEIVINNNYLWGVRDLTKAKQTLKECNKQLPEPPKIEKIPKKTVQKSFDAQNNNIKNNDILVPLAPEYEALFKSSPINKTGIAWVNKIGNNWIYARKIDGKAIAIKDNDIYQLHKKVLEKGLPWGIRDHKKARKVIYNAQPTISTTENMHSKEDATVFVTFNEDIVSIEGKIKNNEILKVLTRIYEFGDNILKLNTQKSDDETSLSIELKLNENQKLEFIDKIKGFGWDIDK